MADITIDQLITWFTPEQLVPKLYTFADLVGLKTTAWVKLSPLRSIFSAFSYAFSALSRAQAAANRGGFLSTATGDWLKLRAKDNYDVDFVPAQFAQGNVSITNVGGGLYSYGIGDLVVLNTAKDKVYTNTAPTTINPLATGLVVPVIASEAGSGSSAAPGQIDAIVAASPLLSVTNAAALVGVDEESEDSVKERCLAKLGSLSPMGPAAAYEYIAKTPALNGGVSVTRAITLPAQGNGTIRVVIAGPDGPIAGTTSDPTSPLGLVFLNMCKLVTPAGYTLLLTSATAHNISGNVTVYVATSSGLSSGDAIAAAQAAETAYVPLLPIGGVDIGGGGSVLYRALEAIIKASAPGIVEAQLAVEADIALGASEVAVLTSSVVTVVQVAA